MRLLVALLCLMAGPLWAQVSNPPSSSGGGVPVSDTTAVVKGGTDPTKLLRFEVDGFTTATTRTLTPPNLSGTIALSDQSQLWTGGVQTFGSGALIYNVQALEFGLTSGATINRIQMRTESTPEATFADRVHETGLGPEAITTSIKIQAMHELLENLKP